MHALMLRILHLISYSEQVYVYDVHNMIDDVDTDADVLDETSSHHNDKMPLCECSGTHGRSQKFVSGKCNIFGKV